MQKPLAPVDEKIARVLGNRARCRKTHGAAESPYSAGFPGTLGRSRKKFQRRVCVHSGIDSGAHCDARRIAAAARRRGGCCRRAGDAALFRVARDCIVLFAKNRSACIVALRIACMHGSSCMLRHRSIEASKHQSIKASKHQSIKDIGCLALQDPVMRMQQRIVHRHRAASGSITMRGGFAVTDDRAGTRARIGKKPVHPDRNAEAATVHASTRVSQRFPCRQVPQRVHSALRVQRR